MAAQGRDPQRPLVTILVARARNGAIGLDNALPWHLPEDLAHFRRTTTGHAIIMGRRTYESIGRPLPNRRSIVVTRDAGWSAPGVERAASLEAAVALCAGDAEVFVIGGAQLFADALPLADRAIVTEIQSDFEADTWFEPLAPPEWEEQAREAHTSATGLRFDIVRYRRAERTAR